MARTFERFLGALGFATFLSACGPLSDAGDVEGDIEGAESASTSSTNGFNSYNGLNSINGLNSFNGLNSINGFKSYYALTSAQGVASNVGLMTSDAGRKTLAYIVRCALPAGRTLAKKDQTGKTHYFGGQLGMAPEWEYGSCGNACQEYVTSCLMAHLNTSGTNVPLWLVSDNRAIGWGRSSTYPNMEGSFFGNIFVSPPKAYYCNGPGFSTNVVPGRLGAYQSGAPYTNPFGTNTYCWIRTSTLNQQNCTPADYPYQNDGFKACKGYNHVMTVWRK